jgi:hypothetical protein
MTLSNVQPEHIRYIKLGSGGWWAQTSFSEGVLCFGFETIPHELCERKDWNEVWNRLRPDKKNDAAATHARNEIKDFYELGEDCLWITFADLHLWWAFAHPEVQWVWDGTYDRPPRKRKTLDGWHKTDIFGKPLRVVALSSKLTQVAKFQGTICEVAEKDYLLRRINGIEEPVFVRAHEARKAMMATIN